MVKHQADLDRVFAALSDSTRRSVLARLGGGPSTVTELAQPHAMSLPGFMKHLAVLEAAGLIARAKEGRIVRCELDAGPLQDAAAWLSRYERFWADRLDALGRYLDQPEESTPCNPAPRPPRPASKSGATTPRSPKGSGARGPTPRR